MNITKATSYIPLYFINMIYLWLHQVQFLNVILCSHLFLIVNLRSSNLVYMLFWSKSRNLTDVKITKPFKINSIFCQMKPNQSIIVHKNDLLNLWKKLLLIIHAIMTSKNFFTIVQICVWNGVFGNVKGCCCFPVGFKLKWHKKSICHLKKILIS